MPDSNTVMRWAGISRRQLDHWVQRELIEPITHSGRGFGGVQYEWSMEEAKVVERMGKLVAAGIPPAMAAKFARGDEAALDRVLWALSTCVGEMRWRHDGQVATRSRGRVISESESCG